MLRISQEILWIPTLWRWRANIERQDRKQNVRQAPRGQASPGLGVAWRGWRQKHFYKKVDFSVEDARNAGSGKSYWKETLSTVDLLALTSLDQLIFILIMSYTFITKQATIMSRLTILSFPVKLAFPADRTGMMVRTLGLHFKLSPFETSGSIHNTSFSSLLHYMLSVILLNVIMLNVVVSQSTLVSAYYYKLDRFIVSNLHQFMVLPKLLS